MIGYLKGTVIEKSQGNIIILAGSVGYDVNVPTSFVSKIKKDQESEVFIYTHVREGIFALYGFENRNDLEFFKLLLSVSGIGPKVALAIVSSAPAEKIKNSISKGDPSLLSAVSGVGKKTAEKAVVELKNKLGFVGLSNQIFEGEDTDEIYSALLGLGFQKHEISDALRVLPDDIEKTDDKIKAILKGLGKNGR